MTRRRGLLTALASSTLLTLAGCDGGAEPDENNPWDVMMSYLDALNASDADAVSDLVDPGSGAEGMGKDRVERFGGLSLSFESLQFNSIGMAGLTTVDLKLRSGNAGNTKIYEDSLSLARSDGRWWIAPDD